MRSGSFRLSLGCGVLALILAVLGAALVASRRSAERAGLDRTLATTAGEKAARVESELEARFTTRLLEDRPYFYRWLKHPPTEPVESELIAAGAIRPIGFRYVGVRR